MNKKTITAIAAFATISLGAIAQTTANPNPPSSTPGAGCTATANAMKGGNMGGSPSTNIDCGPTGATTTTAVPAATAPAATSMGATGSTATTTTTTTDTSSTAATTKSTDTGSTTQRAPARVARADRG